MPDRRTTTRRAPRDDAHWDVVAWLNGPMGRVPPERQRDLIDRTDKEC